MDGCTALGEWWNVLIPAARADLITLAMFVFIGTWSDFLWPLVILDDPGLYTLPLGLQQLSSSFSLDWRLVAAGSVVSILRCWPCLFSAALHPPQRQWRCGEGLILKR